MIDKFVKRTAYIGIGSNSDPEDNLRRCMELLRQRVTVRSVSGVYETEACGRTAGGAKYLNAVIAVETSLPPEELDRRVLKGIETRLGRSREKLDSVVIDLDLLAYSESDPPDIRWFCPPESLEQTHVAVPLADIAPGLRHPLTGRSLRLMVKPLRDRPGIRARPDLALLHK
jgi:2-amino-4-hydroxy-6-hydroxymethyldihydropteridine diphosphokinase